MNNACICNLFDVHLFENDYIHPLTFRMSLELAALQCGPRHIHVHTAKRLWPYEGQTTSESSLNASLVH